MAELKTKTPSKTASRTLLGIAVSIAGFALIIGAWLLVRFLPQDPEPGGGGSTLSVTISQPLSDTAVSGTVTLAAQPNRTTGIAGVQFKLNGQNFGAEDAVAPYTIPWNSTTGANGIRTINAVVRPTSGATATAPTVTVLVDNVTRGPIVTDAAAVYTVPTFTFPTYNTLLTEPRFGTKLRRIAGDTDVAAAPLAGKWGARARHVYSKQQPWNADMSLLMIENREASGTTTHPMLLDGNTYAPLPLAAQMSHCPGYTKYDARWHPSLVYKNVQINVNEAGTLLEWYDVVTCTQLKSWNLPTLAGDQTFHADYGIGSGEGNVSADGRYVAIYGTTSNADQRILIVDMSQTNRVSSLYTIPPCGFPPCDIGNVSISPSGKYVDVKYSSSDPATQDAHRIFAVNPNTLGLSVQTMAAGSLRCGTPVNTVDGWIYPTKHADMALNPFDNNEDVIIGGRSCPSATIGRVVMVRLRDGKVTALSDPSNEVSVLHVSTRNTLRPGWVYVTYDQSAGKRFHDEIVAVKMDGSLAVERLVHTRTLDSGCYACEAHGVPSPDGMRIIFASNWTLGCTPGAVGCGKTADKKDYLIDTRVLP